MKQGINKGKRFGNKHSQNQDQGQPLNFNGQSLVGLEHLTRGQAPTGWTDQIEDCPSRQFSNKGQALMYESITVNDCPQLEANTNHDCPEAAYSRVGDCPQREQFKRTENQWVEIQGVKVFKPIMEPWHAFVTAASSKIKRTGNNQMTFNVSVDKNKMPRVSLSAFDENKQPLFEIHVKQNHKTIMISSSINGAKQREILSLSQIKAFEQKLDSLLKDINQRLDDELKIKVHSTTSKIEEVKDQELDVKQDKSASLIYDLATHPYSQLACYVGLSCLLFVYGKPITAVAGREFITQGYSMIYGAPTYSWWNPASLWRYSNYLSAREHVGHWFYNNAEYIMPALGAPVVTGTVYAVSKAGNGFIALARKFWDVLTTKKSFEAPKQVDRALKEVIESLENLSLEENLPITKDVKSKAIVVYQAKAQRIEEDELALVTVPCRKVNSITANL